MTYADLLAHVEAIAPDTSVELLCMTVVNLPDDMGYVVYSDGPQWVGGADTAAAFILDNA